MSSTEQSGPAPDALRRATPSHAGGKQPRPEGAPSAVRHVAQPGTASAAADLQMPSRVIAVDPSTRAEPNLQLLRGIGRASATLLAFSLAVAAALLIWNYYVVSPWTRDGRVRVQVAAIAPQVSGQITDLRVRDNQSVHKGDVLYVIDQFNFQRTLATAKAMLRMRAADVQVKKVEAQRRQKLSDLATTPEEQQQYAGSAVQAEAAFDAAQQDVDQANINLQRTDVRSPVDGFITNLLVRVGDYAHEGTSNISVIDARSYWIDGYFEETKMAHVCVGDRAEARLMGYQDPIVGHVETVTRGISVSDATPSTQGLPSVDPIYTWVRLAQRVPVRIHIDSVPPGVPLVSGLTATVTLRGPEGSASRGWLADRWHSLRQSMAEMFAAARARPGCLPANDPGIGVSETIRNYVAPPARSPNEINPDLANGITSKPELAH